MTYEERMKVCEELEKYTSECMDEVQEICDNLIRVAGYLDYLSDEFLEQLDKELLDNLEGYKQTYEFVEEEKQKK